MKDRRKIGLGLTAFGLLFNFLGIALFFDEGLLTMGNILFVSGVALTIGPTSALLFFIQPHTYQGTIAFGAGFFLVMIGLPILGTMLEFYGFIVLFCAFWPTLVGFLQRTIPLGSLTDRSVGTHERQSEDEDVGTHERQSENEDVE